MLYTENVKKNNQTVLSWIIVGVTLPLLGVLAWNQFNWLQELQKREESRIQYSMISSARSFSKRLQEELLFLPSLLRIRDGKPEELDGLFSERFQFWQYYAISPSMIERILIVNEKTGEALVWKNDHFEKSSLLKEGLDDDTRSDMEIRMPVNFGRDSRYDFVCVFDRQELLQNVIPPIAKDSLESTDLYAYRIIDMSDGSLVYSSVANYSESIFDEPDIEMPLLEDFRIPNFQNGPDIPTKTIPDSMLETFSFIKQRAKIDPSAPQNDMQPQALGSFLLQIVHIDGSLATLSRKATVQNALISFGIVILLMLLMAALAEATRRSNTLALSQQEFIATITHELKTPLAVISSAAQNLTDGLIKDQQKAMQYGTMIRKEATRLGISIEHFLLYSNTASLSRMKPEPCGVADLVQTALKFTEEERTAAEFRTEVLIPEELLYVLGDRIALESVFQNLAQNVLRHAKDGKWDEKRQPQENRHPVPGPRPGHSPQGTENDLRALRPRRARHQQPDTGKRHRPQPGKENRHTERRDYRRREQAGKREYLYRHVAGKQGR